MLLRGRIDEMFYGEIGEETQRYELDTTIGNYGVHIPKEQWHSLEVKGSSVIFSVKEGPYKPFEP